MNLFSVDLQRPATRPRPLLSSVVRSEAHCRARSLLRCVSLYAGSQRHRQASHTGSGCGRERGADVHVLRQRRRVWVLQLLAVRPRRSERQSAAAQGQTSLLLAYRLLCTSLKYLIILTALRNECKIQEQYLGPHVRRTRLHPGEGESA